jgi:hypothetical protein
MTGRGRKEMFPLRDGGKNLLKGSGEGSGRGSSTEDFERWINGALRVERLSLSLKRLSVEGLWGEIHYWGPWKIC